MLISEHQQKMFQWKVTEKVSVFESTEGKDIRWGSSLKFEFKRHITLEMTGYKDFKRRLIVASDLSATKETVSTCKTFLALLDNLILNIRTKGSRVRPFWGKYA